jgi:hypothetical protein
MTYIYAPEFLHRVECDDFLEQIVPVVALQNQLAFLGLAF